jgi:two-component system NarL family response regulator
MNRDNAMNSALPSDTEEGTPLSRTDVRYWRRRLIHRKYVELTRPEAAGHYAARIEASGASAFFPLGTADAPKAAANALKIYRTIRAEGWTAACNLFSREFTLALFWSHNPIACTYATLFTEPGGPAPLKELPAVSADNTRVCVVEADDAVRQTLVTWFNRLPGFVCSDALARAKDAFRTVNKGNADLVLFNRSMLEVQGGEFVARLRSRVPALPVFAFGIFEESDDIFISLTGVSGGYFLRRRPPLDILEPIAALRADRSISLEQIEAQIKRYFQNLFGNPVLSEDASELIPLTPREHEILNRLSKGYQDKEIADALGISAWTVHNHLKNIFRKLGAHTRTEAVIKYLQK